MNKVILYSLLLLSIASCKKTEKPKDTGGGTYFSVIQFAKDQFNTFSGQPYTLQKVVTLNGKVDSSFEQALTLDWGNVLKPFFESDISDRKFLDQYRFNLFDDNTTDSRTYYYEANHKKLLTRNLQIVTDPFNNRIKSIYVETEKNGKVQKLFYQPLKLIQIQEYESSFLGTDKNLKVEYYFM